MGKIRKHWHIDENGRQCSRCTEYKFWENFYKDAGHSTGYSRNCKPCENDKKRPTAYLKKKKRLARDPVFKVKEAIRGRIRDAIKAQRTHKHNTTRHLIGCTNEELQQWLQDRFYPHPITGEAMTWENHGFGYHKWHVDHIEPLCNFDLSDPEQQKKANHFSNLQPMWHHQNLAKKKAGF